jgi:hypothetical protein
MKRKLEEDEYETQTITVQRQLLLHISRSKLLNLKRTRVVYSMVRRKVIIRNFAKYIFREYQESMKLSQSGNWIFWRPVTSDKNFWYQSISLALCIMYWNKLGFTVNFVNFWNLYLYDLIFVRPVPRDHHGHDRMVFNATFNNISVLSQNTANMSQVQKLTNFIT